MGTQPRKGKESELVHRLDAERRVMGDLSRPFQRRRASLALALSLRPRNPVFFRRAIDNSNWSGLVDRVLWTPGSCHGTLLLSRVALLR